MANNQASADHSRTTPDKAETAHSPTLYLTFSDDGEHIRKWSREPFEGAGEYVRAPELSVMQCENCAWAKTNWRKGDEYEAYVGYTKPTEIAKRESTSVQCRALPPARSPDNQNSDGWPYVSGDDWCAYFKPAVRLPTRPTTAGGE